MSARYTGDLSEGRNQTVSESSASSLSVVVAGHPLRRLALSVIQRRSTALVASNCFASERRRS